jgi:hypothetical protein
MFSIWQVFENRLSEFHTSHTGVKKLYRRFPRSISDLGVIPYKRFAQNTAVICEFHENRHVKATLFILVYANLRLRVYGKPNDISEVNKTGNVRITSH